MGKLHLFKRNSAGSKCVECIIKITQSFKTIYGFFCLSSLIFIARFKSRFKSNDLNQSNLSFTKKHSTESVNILLSMLMRKLRF